MKINRLRDWHRSHYSTDISSKLEGTQVVVMGWVREVRDLGGIRFIILQDQRGKVQVTVSQDIVDEETLEMSRSLHKQDCVAVKGVIKKMEKAPGGAEIIPEKVKVLGVAKQPLPLDVTGRTPALFDARLDARVLDLRSDRNQAVFRIRHVALEAVREFLSENEFLEVNTPKIIASATEGGAALFPIITGRTALARLTGGRRVGFERGQVVEGEISGRVHSVETVVAGTQREVQRFDVRP